MKRKLTVFLSLGLLAIGLTNVQAQLSVGETAEDRPYAVFEGAVLANKQLADLEGKVVVLNYYTPW